MDILREISTSLINHRSSFRAGYLRSFHVSATLIKGQRISRVASKSTGFTLPASLFRGPRRRLHPSHSFANAWTPDYAECDRARSGAETHRTFSSAFETSDTSTW